MQVLIFRSYWVREPRRSEAVFAKNGYSYRSVARVVLSPSGRSRITLGSHPAVGVAVVELNVFERLNSSSVELPVSVIILRVDLF